VIDVHNHLRQSGLGLEEKVPTHDWRFRMFCTILGFIEVDAYKIFRVGMPPKEVPSHLVFMRNSYQGCPDSSIPRRGGQDSTDTSVDDDSHEAEAPLDHAC